MKIKTEFSGGMELLFDNQKEIQIELAEGDDKLLLENLIDELRKNHLKEKEEMFIQ